MGRIIGIGLIVVGVYFAVNHVTGTPSNGEAGKQAEATRSTPQRAGDAVRKSFEQGEHRLERLLPD